MVLASLTLKEDYWESLDLQSEDIEYLFQHLMEIETPQTAAQLVSVLIEDRIRRERLEAEKQQNAGGDPYLPKNSYSAGDKVVFPVQGWVSGEVTNVREAKTYDQNPFKVAQVKLGDGTKREYAVELQDHKLNTPVEFGGDDPSLNPDFVLEQYGTSLSAILTKSLAENDDFVHIAGRWFPRALIVDVNTGNLNLAEAVLDMNSGGPLPTAEILSQVEMPGGVNQNLAEFSLDLAFQNDERFDEVGASGSVAWFLKRLEPPEVLDLPVFLQYASIDYDRSVLDDQMIQLEIALDDELSPPPNDQLSNGDELEVNLIYAHWRSGTLPLSPRLAQLFPSAYESPRVRFKLIDGETGDEFPGWVVRFEKYVFGLREWYLNHGLMPGATVYLKRGERPGEVIVRTESHRSTKEWVRTALIGADGGVVYATLKQTVTAKFDDWMMIALPSDITALDQAWEKRSLKPLPFEQVVVDTLKELAKLNPQSHVHAAELYSGVNLVYRCPPGPVMALLASRPWFNHVGDLHFRYDDSEGS